MVYVGSITAAARKAAGIESRINLIGEKGRKDRIDRRHHAVDASVVALMEPSVAKTLAERSSLRGEQRLTGQEQTWKQYTGLTVGAQERFEMWRSRMLHLTELFNERLAEDKVYVTQNIRLRLSDGNAHTVNPSKLVSHRLGDGLTVQQIDRACTPALWCALTREKDFDEKNGLPAREDRVIRVHSHEIKSSDYIQVFSKRKKTDSDRDEDPFGAITVRGGFVEIGSSIHHARIYRIEDKKPSYAMLRVFTHDLLSKRHSDHFSVEIQPQSISMGCATTELSQAISEGRATYLGWIIAGDELHVPVETFTTHKIGSFLKDYPDTTHWRICGYDSETMLILKPRVLSA